MNNKVIKPGLLLALSCLILVSLVACRGTVADGQVGTANVSRAATPSVKPTETPRAKAGDTALHVITNGRLAFVDDRKLTFRTSGTVAQINVSELDKVTKGQVLAKLDTTSLEQAVQAAELGIKAIEIAGTAVQLDLKQAEYGVNAVEADLKQLQNGVKAATIDLDTATDNFRKISYPYTYSTFVFDVPQAVVYISDANRQITDAAAALQIGLPADQYYAVSRQLQDALDNLAKGRELLARGQGVDVFQTGQLAVKDFWTLRATQQAMDKAELAVEGAKNTVSKMALTADNSRTALKKAQVAVDKVNNDMLMAKNNLNIVKTNLENAIITAPFDGVIADVNVKVGDYLSPVNYAATIAIEIVDPGRMELNVKVNEIDIPNVKLGQKASISVHALPDEQFKGVVASISLLPDAATGVVSYELKIVFDAPQNLALKAGMGATADIIVEKRG